MTLQASHLANAFLLSIVCVLALARVAGSLGLTDRPSARKAHQGRVPLVGGVAIFLSVVVATTMAPGQLLPPEALLGLGLLVVVGVVDDAFDLRPAVRLPIQLAAAMIMVLPSGRLVASVGMLPDGGVVKIGWLGLPFTLIFMIGMVNAMNMLDGLDGLAGGVAAVSFLWLAAAAARLGHPEAAQALLLLVFATLGFLVFNLRHPWRTRAVVFMGDAGSTMLGGCLGFFVVILASGAERAHHLPALLWICAVPAIDTLSLVVRRLAAGQSPFVGDRRHLHHLLLEAGLPPDRATAVLIAAAALCGGIGVAGLHAQAPDLLMAGGLAVPASLHSAFVLWRRSRPARGGGRVAAATHALETAP